MKKQLLQIQENFGENSVTKVVEFRGETTIYVKLSELFEILSFCKNELGFDLLVDICSVDHEDRDPRFEIVYELAKIDDSMHLRVKAPVEDEEEIPSVVALWKTANWHEREVWDLMGLRFRNHPNLKRILMWEGYPFHPLRKEFPLAGKPTEMPDVAFTGIAPMVGGPFVTSSSARDTVAGEPRAKGES
jgi:NADH-quinone oxidoreductase subunit C